MRGWGSADERAVVCGHSGGQGARRCSGNGPRMGAHAPRLEGGHFLRQRVRRILLSSRAGRRPGDALQLRRRGPEADRRMRGRGDRHDRAFAGQGSALRDAGDRHQGRRLGRGSRFLSDSAQAAYARIPARGRAPAPAHQRHRRGHPRASHHRAMRSIVFSTRTASSGSTRRSSPRRTRRARASYSGCRRWTS